MGFTPLIALGAGPVIALVVIFIGFPLLAWGLFHVVLSQDNESGDESGGESGDESGDER